MLTVIETQPTPENLELLADIYMQQGLFDDAAELYLRQNGFGSRSNYRGDCHRVACNGRPEEDCRKVSSPKRREQPSSAEPYLGLAAPTDSGAENLVTKASCTSETFLPTGTITHSQIAPETASSAS
jgi:hypothetical protein